VQTVNITEEQKKELIGIVDQCEKQQPKKLSNIKKLNKYEESLHLFDSKFEEYAGKEAFEELCSEVDKIYDQCSCGMNINNMKEKLGSVIHRRGK